MLKRVQHDNLVCGGSLVWFRWSKKKCWNEFSMTIWCVWTVWCGFGVTKEERVSPISSLRGLGKPKQSSITFESLYKCFYKERLSDWIASLRSQWREQLFDLILGLSPQMTKEKRCHPELVSILGLSPQMTKEKRCHPELVSGSHYSIYPLVFVREIYEMPKQVRHDSEVRVRRNKKMKNPWDGETSSVWQFNISSAYSPLPYSVVVLFSLSLEGRGERASVEWRRRRGTIKHKEKPQTGLSCLKIFLSAGVYSPKPNSFFKPDFSLMPSTTLFKLSSAAFFMSASLLLTTVS